MRAFAFALLLAVTGTPTAFAKPTPLAAAVAAKDRAADHVALDAGRKPAEILQFMQLKAGMTALDLLAGNGYYAEIMAPAVGPKGSVVAFSPATYTEGKSKAALEALSMRHKNLRYTGDLAALMAKPPHLDFVMLHLNYHDFYFESVEYKVQRTDPNMVLAGLFHATKPGGIIAVIDHVGPAGDTRAIVDKVHRIDPETVKADFARASFTFEAETPLLRMATDDLSKNVFDPAIRGKTDRFAFRFRKPK